MSFLIIIIDFELTLKSTQLILHQILQNVLEDVLGIDATEYSYYLKNDECVRFKLIDTYKENN